MDQELLVAALRRFQGSQVLVIGDVMLDHYMVGKVSRISPEAPVPVVNTTSEHVLLGGAANVALNIKRLGGEPHIATVLGSDDNAAVLAAMLESEGVPLECVHHANRPTTVKTRVIAQNQQIVRIDKECAAPMEKHVTQALLDAVEAILDEFDVVVLSDYGKGLLTPDFMEGLLKRITALSPTPKLLIDPKVRNFHLYKDAYCLTPNSSEALEATHRHSLESRADIIRCGAAVFRQLGCEHLLITLGPNGMVLFLEPGEVYHFPTTAKRVYDVTGAGDTVIASMALSLAGGNDLITSTMLSNYAAGIVVGEVGTATTTVERMTQVILQEPPHEIVEWLKQPHPGAGR